MIFKLMFTRRWLGLTIFGIIAGIGMIRLGIWQLDRLEQRRTLNSQILSQIDQPSMKLDENSISDDLQSLEYRKVIVQGVFDNTQEVVLLNQVYQGQYGAHLLTPLRISGTDEMILVDRGWIPADDISPEKWSVYSTQGVVEITGMIRRGVNKPGFGTLPMPTQVPGQNRQTAWIFVNLEQLSQQMNLPLLPVYIQQSPNPSWNDLPYRTEPEFDLSEGPHLGYALQWFTFAAIALLGAPLYIYREEQRMRRKA